jgi:hypothetical protein
MKRVVTAVKRMPLHLASGFQQGNRVLISRDVILTERGGGRIQNPSG